MPQKASQTQEFQDVEIDVDLKYVVKLVALDEQPASYADAKPGEMALSWKLRLWEKDSGAPVFHPDEIGHPNEPYELWQFTNDKTYRNVKTGKIAQARDWAEIFLGGRELSDDEVNELIDDGFAEALVGKKAIADLNWVPNKAGVTRLKIIRLRPYKASKAEAAPAAEPTPMPQAQAVGSARTAAARKALALDDEEEAA